MNSKERVMARLEGKAVDKVPNLNITMLFAARHGRIPYGTFCSDYRELAKAQLQTARDFGIDILSTMSDPFREAYDYGANVIYQEDDLPVCKERLLHGPEDFEKLKRWNPLESVRMLDRIRAVALLKKTAGKEYPVLGWVEGALAEFSDLVNISEALAMLYEEPEFVQACLEVITEQAIDCSMAQIEAGADIIGIGDACASLIGRELYCEFALPYEKRIVDAVHKAGAKVKLHICGNITHLLPDLMEVGMDILDLDYMVDIRKAAELSEGICSLCGNVNPMVILQGTKEKIAEEANSFLKLTNAKSFLSSGCEVPKMTPGEHLLVLDKVCRSQVALT